AITLVRETANASILDVLYNGVKVFSAPILSLQQIVFTALGANDTLTLDSTNGAISLPGGVTYTGGAGADKLVFTGGSYLSFPSGTPTANKWVVDLAGTAGGQEVVTFADYGTGADSVTNSLAGSSQA